MSSAVIPTSHVPVLDARTQAIAGRAPAILPPRSPLSIAATGTGLFVVAVALLSQLASPAWVASTFGW